MDRTRRILTAQHSLMNAKRLERSGVAAVTSFTPDTGPPMGRVLPLGEMPLPGRMKIREMAIGAVTGAELGLANASGKQAEGEGTNEEADVDFHWILRTSDSPSPKGYARRR